MGSALSQYEPQPGQKYDNRSCALPFVSSLDQQTNSNTGTSNGNDNESGNSNWNCTTRPKMPEFQGELQHSCVIVTICQALLGK